RQQDAVNRRAIFHRGGNLARDFPFPLQFELQRADFISLNGAGAEPGCKVENRREFEPLSQRRAGQDGSRLGKEFDLELEGATLAQPRFQADVLEQFAEKTIGPGVVLASAPSSVNGECVARTSHCDIEQATFLLLAYVLVANQRYCAGTL